MKACVHLDMGSKKGGGGGRGVGKDGCQGGGGMGILALVEWSMGDEKFSEGKQRANDQAPREGRISDELKKGMKRGQRRRRNEVSESDG